MSCTTALTKTASRTPLVVRSRWSTGPWRGLDDVEYATLEYVDRFNNRRRNRERGMLLPAEFETQYDAEQQPLPRAASQ